MAKLPAVSSSEATGGRHPWQILTILLIGIFMSLLDVSIVNVALPSIQSGLHASNSALEWIVSGYTLSLGLLLIPAGRLGDNFGHKKTFLVGLGIFTVASLACALAQNSLEITISRFIQGLGAGIYTPAITSFIQLLFQGKARSQAFSVFGATIGFSTAIGPLLGGILVQAGGASWGWRLVFLVNVPIGLILVPLAVKLLPLGQVPRKHHKLDPVGIGMITSALLLLLFPLVEGQSHGWPWWTWASFGAAAALLVGLWQWEKRLENKGREPLLAIHLLRQAGFAFGSVVALVYFAAFTSIFFILSLLWQSGFGRSALATGLMIVPFAIGSMLAAAQSDKLSHRLDRWVLVLGCGLVTIGLVSALVMLHVGGADFSAWLLTGPLFVAGLGNGMFIPPNQDFVLASVPGRDAGSAAGMLSTAQRIGSSLGIAAVGTTMFTNLHVHPGPHAVATAFLNGTEAALKLSVILVLIALLLVFVLPKKIKHPETLPAAA